ncbi:DUF58 domain-containing protein [Ferrimonas sediminicola]|uniref:DUF58 domain-containing protein n=1 Tax=Ferrimonas sediminicola TaxID=2569538 RepID=A0A4U1BBC6_9GAMM|nr:DUF58 domain-containing protein [Ferrimonas sediminicola]TKB48168.1 DUF58 domain-containing protein [Ferrimonas sediminicola]
MSLAELMALEEAAKSLGAKAPAPVSWLHPGAHRSRLLGQGSTFEEMRPYQHGDDIRALDWKLTLRAGRPYVRLCSEERERRVLLVVDQRQSMFFGSQGKTKSVIAAEAAALCAWACRHQGDRVAALIFNDRRSEMFAPGSSRLHLSRALAALAGFNQELTAVAGGGGQTLTPWLSRIASRVTRGWLLILISDGLGWGDEDTQLLKPLTSDNQVVMLQISDPLERQLPQMDNLVVSDGDRQLRFDGGGPVASAYRRRWLRFDARFSLLADTLPMTRIAVTTTQPTDLQLRASLGTGR